MKRGWTGVQRAVSSPHQEAPELLSADVRLVLGDGTVAGEALFRQGHRRDAPQVIAEATALPVGL